MEISASWIWGVGGSLIITVIFYLLQAFGMQSWQAPIGFMSERWYLITPLVIGFGIQVGLFRAIHQRAQHCGGATMATSGGISSGTMLACCMHNLVPLIPILGIGGLATFFAVYQTQVFVISIAVAYLGVGYMSWKYLTI